VDSGKRNGVDIKFLSLLDRIKTFFEKIIIYTKKNRDFGAKPLPYISHINFKNQLLVIAWG